GGSRRPLTPQLLEEGGHFFRMDGRGVRDFVMDHVPPALHRLLRRSGVPAERVDHLVPHQPNGVLLRRLVERAGLSHVHTHRTLEKYGNIGSASVPGALDAARRSGALADGDLVLLAGFGGGMPVGAPLSRRQEQTCPWKPPPGSASSAAASWAPASPTSPHGPASTSASSSPAPAPYRPPTTASAAPSARASGRAGSPTPTSTPPSPASR